MDRKFMVIGAVAVLLGTAGVVGSSNAASAVPSPTVCVPYTVDSVTFPNATLRVTVRACSPVTDQNVITSVCRTETFMKSNGVSIVVSDTCGTTASTSSK